MVAGLAGAFSAIGTIAGVVGQFISHSAQKKAEKLRQRQMELEAARARREQIRRSQAARASAIATATNQGAGATSALAGGVAQIQNEASRNVVAINQDESIGKAIFKANEKAAFGGLITSLGSGISNLGSAFANTSGTITKLGYV